MMPAILTFLDGPILDWLLPRSQPSPQALYSSMSHLAVGVKDNLVGELLTRYL
jgi:hypothetical protein